MERFWGTLDSELGDWFDSHLIGFIGQQYSEGWAHQTLGYIPLPCRYRLLHWTHERAIIQPDISQN
jgi:hypothetical protein